MNPPEFGPAQETRLRNLLVLAGPARSFRLMCAAWAPNTRALILATETRAYIHHPEPIQITGVVEEQVQLHMHIFPFSVVWQCFRRICWQFLGKDPGGFYSRAFSPVAQPEDSWWSYISSSAFGGHANAFYQLMTGNGGGLPDSEQFHQNEN